MDGDSATDVWGGRVPENSVICGFWRRVTALLLDGLLLGLIGIALGAMMFDQLARLGGWGRLYGFCIALVYFGLFNSVVGKGKTPGKRMMKIHVVARDGDYISVGRSFLRYFILGIPWFLNGAMIPDSVVVSPVAYLLSLLVFGFGAAIFYLYLFNRKTRQSLHDLAVGSFVTHALPRGRVVAGPVWKPHLVVAGLLLVIAAGLPAVTLRLADRWAFPELLKLQRSIIAGGRVHAASAQMGKSWGTRNGEKWEKTYFQTVVILKERPLDPESAARGVAKIVLREYPEIVEKDIISITTSYGYDIGIARVSTRWNANYAPEEWQRQIDAHQGEQP
jgi:uncharacterized RDD family membrane protein YckC